MSLAFETKVERELGSISAKLDSFLETQKDHEARIRKAETLLTKTTGYVLGVVAAVSTLFNLFFNWIKTHA